MAGATHGVDLFDGEAVGILWRECALGTRVIKRSTTEIDRQRVLDDLDVALAGRADVLLPGAPNQLLIKRQADPVRGHEHEDTAALSGRRRLKRRPRG
jgi:hypothetical protein